MNDQAILLALDREAAKRIFGPKEDAALRAAIESLAGELTGEDRQLPLGSEYRELAAFLEQKSDGDEAPLPPLAIRGGRPLHRGDDWTVTMVRPDLCGLIAKDLAALEPPADDRLRALADRVTAFYEAASQRGDGVLFVARGNA